MAETASQNDAEVIAPHGPSGFRKADVLEQAETDDTVRIEAEFLQIDEPPVPNIEVTVANKTEKPYDDGRNRMKQLTYYLETEHALFSRLVIRVLTDTKSAHNLIRDTVAVGEGSFDELDEKTIDVHHIEVEKA